MIGNKATSEHVMTLIHQMTGNVHLNKLKIELEELAKVGTKVDYGKKDKDGNSILEPFEYFPTLTPADLTVIQKFLSDSNITCHIDTDESMNEVDKKMQILRDKRSKVLSINKAVNE